MNSVLTLTLIGCERTKWEVPDENSLKTNGDEDFLEYGGKNEFININRVLHNFAGRKKSGVEEEEKGERRESVLLGSQNNVQMSFPFKIELPEWLPSSFIAYLGSN